MSSEHMIVTLSPWAIRDGGELSIRVTNVPSTVGDQVSVEFVALDDIETAWVASVACVSDRSSATISGTWSGIELGREAVIWAVAVQAGGERLRLAGTQMAVVNATTLIVTDADVVSTRDRIQEAQNARYAVAIGDKTGAGAVAHRVLMAIERLYLTRELRIPGGVIRPNHSVSNGADQRAAVDHALETAQWPTRVNTEWWEQRIGSSRPWTTIECSPVWATSFEEAATLAWRARDDVVAVMGLNRGARGRPVATVIEQRQSDDLIKHRIYVEDAHYGGNLLGGFISGEDQRHL